MPEFICRHQGKILSACSSCIVTVILCAFAVGQRDAHISDIPKLQEIIGQHTVDISSLKAKSDQQEKRQENQMEFMKELRISVNDLTTKQAEMVTDLKWLIQDAQQKHKPTTTN